MTTPQFFSPLSVLPRQSTPPTFVDVGGHGDCGFRAVAAGIIDNYLTNPSMDPGLFHGILARLLTFYSGDALKVSEHDTIKVVLRQVPLADLISMMAYTLRQLAVDEMEQKPALYRGAFVAQDEGTSPSNMRQAHVYIDESAIAALSNALSLRIRVQVGEGLFSSLDYQSTRVKPDSLPVTIQLKNSHYRPLVQSVATFRAVSSSVKVIRKAPMNEKAHHLTMDAILANIEKEDQRMLRSFEDHKTILNDLFAEGKLRKADLLAIYIEAIPHSDYLEGYAGAVRLETGTDAFFHAIQSAQTQDLQPIEPLASSDDYIAAQLVHAIARAISIGHLSSDAISNKMDTVYAARRL